MPAAGLGTDLKPEMDAEEKMKHELDSHEPRHEMDVVCQRVEVEGSDTRYEISTSDRRRHNRHMMMPQLQGEEHSQELEVREL